MTDPAGYDAWYRTPRGAWIAQREFALLNRLLRPERGATLLDIGTGTGHFARRYAAAGLAVTGIDPDAAAIDYARRAGANVTYLAGDALRLPFADAGFDYCAAVTSLCFITDPAAAVAEMWRVARRGIVLGLLHRHSLLHRQKAGRGAYAGARWDEPGTVAAWLRQITPQPVAMRTGYAIFLPNGGRLARTAERLLPTSSPWGGFLALALHKEENV